MATTKTFAEKLAKIADKLDKIGMFEISEEIDNIICAMSDGGRIDEVLGKLIGLRGRQWADDSGLMSGLFGSHQQDIVGWINHVIESIYAYRNKAIDMTTLKRDLEKAKTYMEGYEESYGIPFKTTVDEALNEIQLMENAPAAALSE